MKTTAVAAVLAITSLAGLTTLAACGSNEKGDDQPSISVLVGKAQEAAAVTVPSLSNDCLLLDAQTLQRLQDAVATSTWMLTVDNVHANALSCVFNGTSSDQASTQYSLSITPTNGACGDTWDGNRQIQWCNNGFKINLSSSAPDGKASVDADPALVKFLVDNAPAILRQFITVHSAG